MRSELIYEPTRVATRKHGHPEEGFLIFADGALVAVITNLDASVSSDGDLRGHWFLEVGFGPCAVLARDGCIFETPHAAREWVLHRLTGWQPAILLPRRQ